MEREKRDLYDKNSKKTDLTYFKGDPIPDGYYPMVVMVCIQNNRGEFLMQKRVPQKGGDWGVTGGHPKSGQTPEQGIISEVKEELGFDINGMHLEVFSEGCDGVDCYRMYYLNIDLDLDKLTLQEDELTEVRWFSIQELQDMVEKNILNSNQISSFVKCMNYLKNRNN